MNLYDSFSTNKNIERDGVVLDYGRTKDDLPITIRIARAGGANQKFAKILEAKLKPYKRQMANETMDNAVAQRVMIEVYADAVVLGWTNIRDRDGVEMSFTRDNVIKLFTDLPDLFADVTQQAQKAALFRDEIREEDSGNSSRS